MADDDRARATADDEGATMATQAGSEHSDTRTHGDTGPHGRTAHATHHGNSAAAWTMVLILMLGGVVASVGLCIPSITVIVIGAVIVVIGLVAGKVMSLAGYGSVKPTDEETPHGVG
jgi:hypothetical protein